jgi:hypothetical protein
VKKTAPPADWSADNNAADNDDQVTGFHGAQIEPKPAQKASGNSSRRKAGGQGLPQACKLPKSAMKPPRFRRIVIARSPMESGPHK